MNKATLKKFKTLLTEKRDEILKKAKQTLEQDMALDTDDLPAYYRSRTRLGVNVEPEDVAEAIAFFAGPRTSKSTGNILNVDGGVQAAYPR